MKIKNKGFTLIELMIAIAVIGVLSAIAYPAYLEYGYQARRSAAQAALVSLANAMEQWKMENNDPSKGYLGAAVGGGDTGAPGVYPANVPSSGNADYQLTISTADTSSYTLTATPVGVQVKDGVLTLDSMGIKTCDTAVDWCNDADGKW